MGDSASSSNARSLREVLVGHDRLSQHEIAVRWARDNNREIDLFGQFAIERHLIPFQSGSECNNWIDPIENVVYKMNMLLHVGEDILKLLDRIDLFNELFPELALRFIGFQIISETSAYPVFAQSFISCAEFATPLEINEYMNSRGFVPTGEEGVFSNGDIILSDIKPKNVLRVKNGGIAVIDAEASRVI